MQVTPSHVPKQLFFTVADIYQLMCDKLSTAAHQETRCNPHVEDGMAVLQAVASPIETVPNTGIVLDGKERTVSCACCNSYPGG